MKVVEMFAASFLLLSVVAPAVASETNPRDDIIKAITLLPTVEDRQLRAEANLLIDQAQHSLKDGSRYQAHHLIQRALKLIDSSQIKHPSPQMPVAR